MTEMGPRTAEDAALVVKARLREAVRLAGGPSFVAKKVGLSTGHMTKVTSPQYEEQIQPGLIPLIEDMAGSPVVTEGFAEMQGYRLLHGGIGQSGAATLKDLSRIINQSGDFLSTFSEALADQIIDAHERRTLNASVESLIGELRAVQAKINGSS